MENILVTICARGGSKGVKNKNIRKLLDKPLIYYTIKQAREWGKATRVIVSTDSDEISQVAERYGAEVPFKRPTSLASDSAAKVPVIRHALQQCEEIYGEIYSIVVDLDATAPIRARSDLDNCLSLFKKENPQTLFSVVLAHKNPYFNMVERNIDGEIKLCKTLETDFIRRQDAPVVYSLNASIYFYNRDYLLNENNNTPISSNTSIYVMNDVAGIDIDREIDFQYIEFLLKEKIVTL